MTRRAARSCLSTLGAVAAALLLSVAPAAAREAVALVGQLTVPGNTLTSFDISFVDDDLGIYLLADRTNKAVDVVNLAGNQVIGQLASPTTPFQGFTGNNDTSGPDGVITVDHSQIWVGDGDSTIKVFDAFTGALITVIKTGGTKRADELCWDPKDNLVMMANDADDPPFVTLISTKDFGVKATIKMDGVVGPKATNGIEQCQFVKETGNFLVNIPEVNGPGDDSAPGATLEISPKTMKITKTFDIPIGECAGPQGMAVGAKGHVQLGCHLNGSVIIDAKSGKVLASFPHEDGIDEAYYNAKDKSFYLAGSSPTAFNTQLLFSNDDQPKLTADVAARTGIKSGVGGVSRGSNHSVAASAEFGTVYVPIAGNTNSVLCSTFKGSDTQGCIAVFLSE